MYLDVSELRDFYYQTRLGRSVQRRIQTTLKTMNDSSANDLIVGFGFASPFLRPFRNKYRNIVNLMPEKQGAMAWPPSEPNVTAMCPEVHWPLKAGSADFILMSHALERSEKLNQLLGEAWRVLAPEGRIICIVPNRLGVWASSDATPFGTGRPFSYLQIERLMQESGFDVLNIDGALYAPPAQSKFGQKSERIVEWALSGRSRRFFAGALIVEVTKHVGVMPPKLRHNAPVLSSPALSPVIQGKPNQQYYT